MKYLIAGIITVCSITITSQSMAQDYKSALGVRFSTKGPVVNNSVTFKYFISEGKAIEAFATLADPFALGALFEIHRPTSMNNLQWFFGAGAYVGFSKESAVGGMGVVGLDYKFDNIPLNLSIDWKPEINIINTIGFEPAAIGISARFVFGKN
jgi:hypothetical protein